MVGNPMPGRARDLVPVDPFEGPCAIQRRLYCPYEAATSGSGELQWIDQDSQDSPSPWRISADPVGAVPEDQITVRQDTWGPRRRLRWWETRYDRGAFQSAQCEEDNEDDTPFRADDRPPNPKRGSKPNKGRVTRNARERRRVEAVSGAFVRLRKVIPQAGLTSSTNKRLSKLKTLRCAIRYIMELQKLLKLDETDETLDAVSKESYYDS